jgi:SpoVK/Ycf46/Vps4 family AAA+-type ATPase
MIISFELTLRFDQANRMSHIFSRLKAMENTIILFDEIEEFCLDRENPNLSMQSRLLTTAMLTQVTTDFTYIHCCCTIIFFEWHNRQFNCLHQQLNDLRRQQSCIFIVATNRLRSFDAAVTRPGRFDMLLFVGTSASCPCMHCWLIVIHTL